MIFAGIDAGSRAIKIVLLDGDSGKMIAHGVAAQGVKQQELALTLLDETLKRVGSIRDNVGKMVATGYGRDAIEMADTTITEITCHARGVVAQMPDARTVVDIGGQDSKLMRLDDGGVRDFVMNDRCAAGTGRFLEVVASRLGVALEDLGEMSSRADSPSAISSMCVVFAETEIIGLLASGESPENIVAGVQVSIASRISSMGGRNILEPIIFTGGVAMIPGMDRAMASALDHPVTVADNPQMTGALGAALLATDELGTQVLRQ